METRATLREPGAQVDANRLQSRPRAAPAPPPPRCPRPPGGHAPAIARRSVARDRRSASERLVGERQVPVLHLGGVGLDDLETAPRVVARGPSPAEHGVDPGALPLAAGAVRRRAARVEPVVRGAWAQCTSSSSSSGVRPSFAISVHVLLKSSTPRRRCASRSRAPVGVSIRVSFPSVGAARNGAGGAARSPHDPPGDEPRPTTRPPAPSRRPPGSGSPRRPSGRRAWSCRRAAGCSRRPAAGGA